MTISSYSKNFLGIDLRPSFARSRYAVVPVPYARTVSYGGGAEAGPDAVIDASYFVETFDEQELTDLENERIFTLEPWPVTVSSPDAMSELIYKRSAELIRRKKRNIFIGGEHSITYGIVRAYKKFHPSFTCVVFDAHSDLRKSYMDSIHSHACTSRRIHSLGGINLIIIGVRSITREDYEFADKAKDINIFYAHDKETFLKNPGLITSLLKDKIYLSFDVDAFDSSIMPSTGTPEPGGLLWDETLKLLKTIISGRKMLGCDFVELAPTPANRAPAYMTAKLICKTLSFWGAGR